MSQLQMPRDSMAYTHTLVTHLLSPSMDALLVKLARRKMAFNMLLSPNLPFATSAPTRSHRTISSSLCIVGTLERSRVVRPPLVSRHVHMISTRPGSLIQKLPRHSLKQLRAPQQEQRSAPSKESLLAKSQRQMEQMGTQMARMATEQAKSTLGHNFVYLRVLSIV